MATIVNIDFKEKFQALRVQLSLNIRTLELFHGHMLSTNQVGFYTKIISSFTFACIRGILFDMFTRALLHASIALRKGL